MRVVSPTSNPSLRLQTPLSCHSGVRDRRAADSELRPLHDPEEAEPPGSYSAEERERPNSRGAEGLGGEGYRVGFRWIGDGAISAWFMFGCVGGIKQQPGHDF